MVRLAKALRGISDTVDRGVVFLLALLIGLLGVVVMMTVFFRFVIHLPLAWAEDTSRALMVWISFLGASAALKRGLHISLSVFQEKLPPDLKRGVSVVSSLIVLAFLVVVFLVGAQSSIGQWGQMATYFEIPMTFIYGSAPLSMAIMALHTMADILVKLSGLETTGGDEASEGQPDRGTI